jgi:phosphatidylethanolamine-binding protein (PEBP) family uncharacterized protein
LALLRVRGGRLDRQAGCERDRHECQYAHGSSKSDKLVRKLHVRVLLDVIPTYQRLLATATALFLVTGCGDKKLDKPLPPTHQKLRVTGPWKQGGRISKAFTCDGADARPAIGASPLKGAKDLAVVMTDPDAPGGTFVHWTQWGRGTEGKNSFGSTGYKGPCPPKGDKAHRYVITVYALRSRLGLPAGSEPDRVVAAIRAKALASGSLTGLYGR